MKKDKIEELLKEKTGLEILKVSNVNKNYFKIIAISDRFHGMDKLKRHRIIYSPLVSYFVNKDIHAVSIETYTSQEWKNIVDQKIS